MTKAVYINGNGYIEVPDHSDFSLISNGTKKMTVIYKYQPSDLSKTIRMVEKGRVPEYEWVLGHRPESGQTNFFGYEFNKDGGYGIGIPWIGTVNVPNEKITIGITFNDYISTDRYLSIYKNGVLTRGHRRVDGVAGVKITNAGSGYTSAPTVTITSVNGQGSGASISASISGGRVSVGEMANYGQGYTANPTVTFSAPPSGGTRATGTAYRVGQWAGASPLYIGGNPNSGCAGCGNYMKGYLYEVIIFKDEISGTDMAALYNGTKKPTDFSSLVMWHNYTLGNANDQSDKCHNGIIRGTVQFIDVPGTTPTLNKITISPSSATVSIGKTQQLTVQCEGT